MKKNNVLNSPRLLELKKHRRRVFKNKILLYFFFFLIALVSLTFLSRVSIFNIAEVEVVGNKVIDTEKIKTVVKEKIAGYYLWFLPKTNILFYPKNGIKNYLTSNFQRLRNTTLSIKSDKVLEVSVDERVGLYTWCGVMLELNNNKTPECYFLDRDGYIFDEAPYFSGEVYFKFYGSIVSKDNLPDDEAGMPVGSYFLPNIFQKLILFKEALSDMGLKPMILYKEESGDIKIFLSSRNTLPLGPEIILKADFNLEITAENLQAALSTEPLQSKLKNKYSSLLYIDLRFGNKVYYKSR